MAPLISLEEVKKHRHKDSVWMIIHNDIYDVTSFLEEHPGGEDSLMDFAGKDGTQGFEDVGHSDDARELMKKYKIGSLSPDDRTKDVTPYCKSKTRKRLSCPHIPKMEKSEKTWRTFDGPASSRPVALKSECKIPTTPRTERRVQSITVPRESSNLKWALLALAGALVLGIVLKKYLGSK